MKDATVLAEWRDDYYGGDYRIVRVRWRGLGERRLSTRYVVEERSEDATGAPSWGEIDTFDGRDETWDADESGETRQRRLAFAAVAESLCRLRNRRRRRKRPRKEIR